jgi:hypothetical protein
MDVPRPSNNYGMGMPQPGAMQQQQQQPGDIRALKSHCQFGLREYQSLQRKRQRISAASTSTLEIESRLRNQQGAVLADLQLLGEEVKGLVKAAENHRWRRWLIGGAM